MIVSFRLIMQLVSPYCVLCFHLFISVVVQANVRGAAAKYQPLYNEARVRLFAITSIWHRRTRLSNSNLNTFIASRAYTLTFFCSSTPPRSIFARLWVFRGGVVATVHNVWSDTMRISTHTTNSTMLHACEQELNQRRNKQIPHFVRIGNNVISPKKDWLLFCFPAMTLQILQTQHCPYQVCFMTVPQRQHQTRALRAMHL